MTPMTDERLANLREMTTYAAYGIAATYLHGLTDAVYEIDRLRAKHGDDCVCDSCLRITLLKTDVDSLRAELAITEAEMKPLAAHVQRDFEQVGEIARLRTRNEKLQAELADCQRQAAAMRELMTRVFQQVPCLYCGCGPGGYHAEACPWADALSGTAGRGFVPVEVADGLYQYARHHDNCAVSEMTKSTSGARCSCDFDAALFAYLLAKGRDGTPPTASAEERFEDA